MKFVSPILVSTLNQSYLTDNLFINYLTIQNTAEFNQLIYILVHQKSSTRLGKGDDDKMGLGMTHQKNS